MATLDRQVLHKAWRASSSWTRLLPDFLIIGTQKGGTTSLYNYLIEHPGIGPAYTKEIHFFNLNFSRGPAWYRAQFPSRLTRYYAEYIQKTPYITGEASPYYLFHPQAPMRAARYVPKVKLLAILRNPVDRAYSQYQHQLRQPGVEPFTV